MFIYMARKGREQSSSFRPSERRSGRSFDLAQGLSTTRLPTFEVVMIAPISDVRLFQGGRSDRPSEQHSADLEQVANPKLSFECIGGEVSNDRNAKFCGNDRVFGRLVADHEIEREK